MWQCNGKKTQEPGGEASLTSLNDDCGDSYSREDLFDAPSEPQRIRVLLFWRLRFQLRLSRLIRHSLLPETILQADDGDGNGVWKLPLEVTAVKP